MKRLNILAALFIVIILFLGSGAAYSQVKFKIPFKFEAEGKSFPPGEYWIAHKEDGIIAFRRGSGGEEISIQIIERMAQPTPPIEEPLLIFDMVGNFEPSYTEYVTDYLLAEVWLTGEDGFLVINTERSEYHKSVKEMKAKK